MVITVEVTDPIEGTRRPIEVAFGRERFALRLTEAKRLRDSLSIAIAEVGSHFQCSDSERVYGCLWRCAFAGSVKIGDKWYCKRHAKKAAEDLPEPIIQAIESAIAKAEGL